MSSTFDFMNSEADDDFKDPHIYHDRVLTVEGTKFYVVSGLLSLRSEYFRGLLGQNYAEASLKEIEMKEVDPKDFEGFLRIIYDNNGSSLDDSLLIPMIDLSYRLLAPRVLKFCKDFIYENLEDLDDLKLELLKTACAYDIIDLKESLEYELSDDELNKQFNMYEFIDVLDKNNVVVLKKFISSVRSKFITIDNCCDLLDFCRSRIMINFEDMIYQKMLTWNDDTIPENRIIDMLEYAFEHNVEPLKNVLQSRLSLYEKQNCCLVHTVKPFGAPEFRYNKEKYNESLNYFLVKNKNKIDQLPKDIRKFIFRSSQ